MGAAGGSESGIYITTSSGGIKNWWLTLGPTGTAPPTPAGLVGFEANAPVTISQAGIIHSIPTAFGLTP